ncbi:GlxA family transcriptional regulator [Antribacter gilvus]|uniref:GlxA family transcriptional regulator n=1 Tax=Antribacter gilvus TaxID=2304675 RepID=UPI000F7A7E0C|nr:helix-turn-helix domain-containing protein [Antribacter gilvus]
MTGPAPVPHKVAVLVRPGFIPLELGIPHRILGRARDAAGHALYEVVTCTPTPGPVPSDTDVTILVERGAEALAEADTVIVPAALDDGPELREGRLSDAAAVALGHVRPGTRLVSICVGSFVLAAAGLLDGRPASTHWADADDFRRFFPKVLLDPDVLYVDDGDVLTSAGVASGLDLCLHIVRRDHGAAVADDVARRTVVQPHREGGQAQYVRRAVPAVGEAGTAAARAWALNHLDQPLPLRDLADRCAMSVRTFTRRFREETGESPGAWLARRRIERACTLLETSDLPVEQVAARAGFGTAQSLRLRMQETLGTTPTSYRRTFLLAR